MPITPVCSNTGEMDVQVTTPVEVQRKSSPLGTFWLTRRRSSKSTGRMSSNFSGEIVELVREDAPVPPPKDPRPNPVKMLSDTAVNVAAAAFKHRAPQRANTMAGALVTAAAGASAVGAPAVRAVAPASGAVVPGTAPGDANGEQSLSFVNVY